jgi:transcriptional regulator with XRE-family HTH domain
VPRDPVPEWVLTRRRALGDRIRVAREGRRISQERLAELVNTDRKTINRIELGAHSTSVDRLILIADALDVPLAELVK